MALTPKSLIEAHTAVRAIVEREFPSAAGRIAVDAAAGNGYMSDWLRGRGFDVRAFDLDPSGFVAPGLECKAADLSERIPLADATADLAISIETIEHLENPFQFVRELARVTKPGGTVIITTPNVHFIRARMKAFFTGTSTFFEFVEKDPWGQHIMPFSVGQIMYAFDRSRLSPTIVESAGPKRDALRRYVFEAVNGLTWIGALALRTKRQNYPDHYLNRLSREDLWELGRHEILVVGGRKT